MYKERSQTNFWLWAIFHIWWPILLSLRKNCPNTEFSGPYFPVFGLNTKIYWGNLGIQSKYGKIWTRKTTYLNTFHEECCHGRTHQGTFSLFPFFFFFFEKQSVAIWLVIRYSSYLSSSPEMFCKKGALRIFAKSKAKHLS